LLQVNLASNIQLFRAFLPGMRRKGWGRTIFSSSVTSICGADSVSLYSATKAGLNGFVRSASVEVGRDGITVNSLVLGMFHTEMIDEAVALRDKQDGPGAGLAWLDDMSSMTAIGRPCRLDEIEGVIALLASDAGSAITGSNLVIDGGMSIMLRPIAVCSERNDS
jgi:NAD(P)-dependent dehydrogenase (short-subunit alcohol dehydrogenase family)